MTLSRQFTLFVVVGLAAAIAHFGALIGLVEAGGWAPEPATLVGYVAGGIVSYTLNRSHTYSSDRPHAEAGWRFALVAGVGFVLTYLFMSLLHGWFGLHYRANSHDRRCAGVELYRPQALDVWRQALALACPADSLYPDCSDFINKPRLCWPEFWLKEAAR